MHSKVAMLIFGLIITIVNQVASDTRSSDTQFIVNFYEDIGCTKNSSSDVISYECPDFKSLDSKKCYFMGKSYEDSEVISYEDSPKCVQGCLCRVDDEGARFQCPQIGCFTPNPEPGCVRKYASADACCSTGEFSCDDTGSCYLNDKSYRDGELFYPEDEICYKCVCSEEFNNSTEITQNPNCAKIQCASQLHYWDQILNGCTPIYNGRCCPSGDWKCPTGDETVIASNSQPMPDAPKCEFGSLSMNIGDRLKSNKDEKSTCECEVPPMLTCTQNV